MDTLPRMGPVEAIRLHRSGKLEEAEAACRKHLRDNPSDYAAMHVLGTIVHDRGRTPEAVDVMRQAVALAPRLPQLRVNLAALLGQIGELEEGLNHLLEALKVRGDIPELHNNLGVTLERLGRAEEAAASYRTAIALRNDYPEAHSNLGNALRKLGKFDQAIEAYHAAISLRATYPTAYSGLSDAFGELGDADQAIACRRRTLEVTPGSPQLDSNLLFTLLYSDRLSPAQLRQEAEAWARQYGGASKLPPPANDRDPDRTLRVGYLSPDFRGHTIAHLIEPILMAHDRDRFQVFCYSSVAKPDSITSRLKLLAGAWRDVRNSSDDQTAAIIRQDEIDILVELAGHMGDNRLMVLARRPAPLQVQLGYAGTTGLPEVDYRITDAHCDPAGTEAFYTERLVRLPHCAWPYQPNDVPEPGPLPALRAGHITFGCLNKTIKITSDAAELWCKILQRVSGSRLILLSPPDNRGLIERFTRHGLEPARLILIPRLSGEDYLRLFSDRIDIALDTFPYNGDTTTCDGLWMGVPLISLAGDAFVSRRGVSHLVNVGLDDLVAQTREQYVDKAVALANNLPALADLRAGLRQQTAKSPLTDGVRYARNLEAAFRQIWAKWCKA